MNRVSRARYACALAAAVGLLGLAVIGPVDPAGAQNAAIPADPVDQITGNGITNSAVTVTWAQGLVGADNTTVVKPREANSPFAFMYPDFQNLSVTVGQTQSLVHQSIKVTWTGGKPTQHDFSADFLQMMECYGDANTGPDPEDCEYGSAGLLPAGSSTNPGIARRDGNICVSRAPDTADPPGAVNGSAGSLGCDPGEPAVATHLDPGADTNQNYSVPFVPVDTTTKIYGQPTDYFNRFNTNEVQEANTGPDGTGQVFFQSLTVRQAPGLGCGELETGGRPRGCWLVIVPRGEYEPNGWKLNGSIGRPGFVNESPLGASSWAQRIQIHLGYDPVQPNCAIGSAKERETIGTELVSHAVFSWQLALNSAAQCKTLYGYSATPEATNTSQLAFDGGVGLAFTTIPVGSEVTRTGGTPPTLPPLVYAPVAVSALAFGFNVNLDKGFVNTPVKLTPRLVAKALTQSYRTDLPDVDSNNPGPTWAQRNPSFITTDPEFMKLNPTITTPPSGNPLAPLLTADHSGLNQQVWAWIQADAAARTWLAGTPDENGMVVNPNYQSMKLGAAPAVDSFPRADPTCFNTGAVGERPPGRCSLDLLPYMENYDDATSRVRASNNPEGAGWDPAKLAPDGQTGWWASGGIEPAGATFLWAVTDSADLANYGLVPADLCDAAGTACVSPNSASVATALSTARADSSGLLHVDPAKPGTGGYPFVDVTYAAVRKSQDPSALADFAALITFAAGTGQTPGVDPGQLPHGYLPMPDNLRAAATAAATSLTAGATPTPTATATTPADTNGGGTGGGATGGTGGVPNGGGAPVVSASSASGPAYSLSPATPTPSVRATAATTLSPVRWVLFVVVITGLVGTVCAPLARFLLSRPEQ